MSGKHRSIGERMGRAKSLGVRKEIATDWAENWIRDIDDTIARLEQAIGQARIADAGQLMGQLKAAHGKAAQGVFAVINGLADDDI